MGGAIAEGILKLDGFNAADLTVSDHNRQKAPESKVFEACKDIWNRYGNGNPDKLNQLAIKLQEYFK